MDELKATNLFVMTYEKKLQYLFWWLQYVT